jgi:hypothetical protein
VNQTAVVVMSLGADRVVERAEWDTGERRESTFLGAGCPVSRRRSPLPRQWDSFVLPTRRVCARSAGPSAGHTGFRWPEERGGLEPTHCVPLAHGAWPRLRALGRSLVVSAASVLAFRSPRAALRVVGARFVGRSAGGSFALAACGRRQFRHLHEVIVRWSCHVDGRQGRPGERGLLPVGGRCRRRGLLRRSLASWLSGMVSLLGSEAPQRLICGATCGATGGATLQQRERTSTHIGGQKPW